MPLFPGLIDVGADAQTPRAGMGVRLRGATAGKITHKAPATVTADYTATWPAALPASKRTVRIEASGQIVFEDEPATGGAAWESFGGDFRPLTSVIASGDRILYRARVADGASAVAHRFTNATALAAAGAKIASFCSDDGATERAFLDKDGNLDAQGGCTLRGGYILVTPGSSYIQLGSGIYGSSPAGIAQSGGDNAGWLVGRWYLTNVGWREGWRTGEYASLYVSNNHFHLQAGLKLKFGVANYYDNFASGTYWQKSAGSGGSSDLAYDGTVTYRDDGSRARWLASRGLHLCEGIADAVPADAREASATVTTTDATTSTLYSRTLDDDSTWVLDIHVTARRSDAGDESASYWRRAVVKRRSGSAAALVGTVETPSPDKEDTAAWDVAVDVSGNAVRVRVTGEVAKTVKWRAGLRLAAVN